MLQFGSLTIGDKPRVVATLSSYDALERFATLRQRPCDIAEIRLDLIGPDRDWVPVAEKIETSGTPTILTLRAAYEGGKWSGPEEDRLSILNQAKTGVSAIDVELRSGLAAKLRGKKPIIVSFHDFTGTPSLDVLIGVAEQALSEGDVAKVSTMIRDKSDLVILRALLARSWKAPICIIGMGPHGEETRTEFPRSGSCLTYGYFEASAAPGQLPAEKLMAHLATGAVP